MAITRPTLAVLIDRITADLGSRLLDGDTPLRRSVLAVLARALAGQTHLLYGYLEWLGRQPFVDTADSEYLDRHASIWGLTRKPAVASAGYVVLAGTDGVVIPAGTEMQRIDGVLYTTDAEATIVSGSATVTITASEPGENGDTDPATALTLTSPISSLSSTATVDSVGLTGGVDAEGDEELRGRVLTRIQAPPQGGCADDYGAWALAVPGVTRVWVYPRHLGAGTVGVAIVNDDADDTPIPNEAIVTAAQEYIDTVRPVTAEVTVFAPEAYEVAVTMALTPNTSAVQAAVTAELRDLFAREAVPGGTIYLSHIREAISVATGETNHVLSAPAADITPGTYQFPVLGSVTFS